MFDTYDLTRGEPVRVSGYPYGHSLALPQFLGGGQFRDHPDDPVSQDELDRQCWETDGGPCGGER